MVIYIFIHNISPSSILSMFFALECLFFKTQNKNPDLLIKTEMRCFNSKDPDSSLFLIEKDREGGDVDDDGGEDGSDEGRGADFSSTRHCC